MTDGTLFEHKNVTPERKFALEKLYDVLFDEKLGLEQPI